MFDRMIGEFLLEQGKVTMEQLQCVYETQETNRVRLGLIAESERMMTMEQVEEVNSLQTLMDKRFGDIAVEKGYLTQEQVSRLLQLQGNTFLVFMQSIIDNQVLSLEELHSAVDSYQKLNNFTQTNMEDLKSCDVDRIISVFLYQEAHMVGQVAGIMIRTMNRVVDYHMFMKKPRRAKEYKSSLLSVQVQHGDHNILLALASDSEGMRRVAEGFAGPEMIDNEEEALDAVCELINCANGLLATNLCNNQVNVDMLSPDYYAKETTITGENLLIIPLSVFGQAVDCIISFDCEFRIN